MKVQELAEIVDGRVSGDEETRIERIADLDQAREHEIAYVDNEKFFEAAVASGASCLILPFRTEQKFTNLTLIEVAYP
jgi:UDP-3-O-[3-hydroxymyristoyl] glucosamine N-acyltransferase